MKFTEYVKQNGLDKVENIDKLTVDQKLKDMAIMKVIIDKSYFENQLEANKVVCEFQKQLTNSMNNHKDEYSSIEMVNDFVETNSHQIEQTERLNYLFEKKINACKYLLDRYETGNLSKDVLISMFYLNLTSSELEQINNAGTYLNMFLKVNQIENAKEEK